MLKRLNFLLIPEEKLAISCEDLFDCIVKSIVRLYFNRFDGAFEIEKYSLFHAIQTYGRKITYIFHYKYNGRFAGISRKTTTTGILRWIKLFGSNDRMISYIVLYYCYSTVIQVLRQCVSKMRMFYKTASVFPLENLLKHFANRTPEPFRCRLFNGWYSVCIRFTESETSQRSKPSDQSLQDPLLVFL